MTEETKDESMDLGQSLAASLRSDEAVSIASDAGELALDAGLAEGLLRDIPVVGTLISITKVGLSVRDTLFVRKIVKFLGQMNEVPKKDRQQMIEKLESDPDYGRRAGEHLIEILERIDSQRKPEMTARAFAAFVSGTINVMTLHRLNNAIEKIPFYEINSIRRIDESITKAGQSGATDTTYQSLENAGLMKPASAFGGLAYQPNDLFKIFLELELDRVGIH